MISFVAALGALPACNGETSAPTGADTPDGGAGGQGGSGEQGGSTGPGDSGKRGRDPSTSVGGGRSSAPPPVPPPTEEITLTASQSTTIQLGGQSLISGLLSACEGRPDSGPHVEILAEEGACRVLVTGESPPAEALQLGQVVASAPSIGSVDLLPAGASSSCVKHTLQPGPDFLAGETVTFQVGAGTDTPDFQLQVASPPPLTVSGGDTLTKGLPFTLSWESGDARPTILVFTLGGRSSIECTPSLGTSIVIPGGITGMLDGRGTAAFVGGQVRAPGPQMELSPGFRARGVSTRTAFKVVTYSHP